MAYSFLLGGARSGKSSLGVRMAQEWDLQLHIGVHFVATAEAFDDEMEDRIGRHQRERPTAWSTLEFPRELAEGIAGQPNGILLIDCLSLWVSNLMLDDVDEIEERADAVVALLRQRSDPSVVVSNEVGMGIVPENALARRYRDILGRVNAKFASGADAAYLVVGGQVVALSAPTAAFRIPN
jgi:adenosylcobinamide kinase / adenosylcobinamide-phosphate guanylyltransferase